MATTKNDITHSILISKLKYDSDTGEFTWIKSNRVAGYTCPLGYVYIRIGKKLYRAHRLAWLYVYNQFPIGEIDHIDGNPNNNSIKNLRLSNSTQNKCNTKIRKDNTSGVKGVHWYKAYSKWQVKVTYNKITTNLGYYTDFFEACCVAISERNRLHKEFVYHGSRK